MATAFNLTAQLNLQGPSNIRQIVSDVKKQLGTISADVKFKIDPASINNTSKLSQALQSLDKNLASVAGNAQAASVAIKNFGQSVSTISSSSSKLSNNLAKTTKAADNLGKSVSKTAKSVSVTRTEMEEFGRQSALAIRRFAAFSAVTGVFFSLNRAINSGLKSFIEFDRQLVRLQQVTGKSAEGLKGLQDEITRLSIGLGVSSDSLIQVSSTLAQAGLSANETKAALEALAKSELAPSFDNINQTVEGSIALMRQFGISAKELEKALGSVNAVAAAFAVESGDIIAAIQRTGGVFASASRGVSEGTDALNEFIAVFTSVRATTRESAETIATGLRTIFTRIQRAGTIEALKEFGVTLTDAEGKFVGAYKAIELLSQGLNTIDPRDLRFSQIVEELGGFRQIGKVIPLIQQFATAQEALKVAQGGQGSLAADAAKAQLSLANQIAKVREEFLTLIRGLGQSDTFQTLAKGALGFASGLIKITSALKGVLPALAILGAGASLRGLTQFTGGFLGGLKKVPNGEGGEQQGIARSIGSNLGASLVGAKTEQVSRDLDQNSTALDKVSGKLDNLTSSLNSLNNNFNSINSTLNSYNSLLQQSIASLTSNTSSLDNLTNAINNFNPGGGPTTVRNGGKILGFNKGGVVPGSGKGDKVHAMLEPGEIVISNQDQKRANRYRSEKYVQKYFKGGPAEYSLDDLIKHRDSTTKSGSTPSVGTIEKYVKSIDDLDSHDIVKTEIIPEEIKLNNSDFQAMAQIMINTEARRLEDKERFSNNLALPGLGSDEARRKIVGVPQNWQSLFDRDKSPNPSRTDKGRGYIASHWAMGNAFEQHILTRVPGLKSTTSSPGPSPTTYKDIRSSHFADLDFETGDAKFTNRPNQYQQDYGKKSILSKRTREGLKQGYIKPDGRPDTPKYFVDDPNTNPSFILPDTTVYYPEEGAKQNFLKYLKHNHSNWIGEGKNQANIQKFNGGPIQKFMSGSPGGVEEPPLVLPDDVISYLKPFGNVGDIARTKLMELLKKNELKSEEISTDFARTKMMDVIIAQVGALGGIEPMKKLVGLAPGNRDLNSLLRKNAIGSTDSALEKQVEVVNKVLDAKGVKDAEYAAKIAKMTKVGVVGLIGENGELDYSKTFDDWDIGNGRKVFATVKGLQSKYLDAYVRLQQDTREAKTRFQENLQYTDIFTGDPLVFDFDETLVTGADILTEDKKPDYPKYSDRIAVEQALSKAKLTRLGTKLKSLIEADPEFINQTRILTARPQSTADLLATKLQQLGLPYSPGYITGVSQDVGKGKAFSSVAKAKSANLGELEKLVDDNLENIQAAQESKRQTFLYRNPEALGPEYDEKFGQGNIEGSFLEAALAELGANLPPIDKLEQNRAVDFPNGLGPAAQFFGIDPTIPTEVKRRLNNDSFTRARAEFGRYYDENPDKFNIGGLVQRLMAGGEAEESEILGDYIPGSAMKALKKLTRDFLTPKSRKGGQRKISFLGQKAVSVSKNISPELLKQIEAEGRLVSGTGIGDIPRGDPALIVDKIVNIALAKQQQSKAPKQRKMDARTLRRMAATAGGVDVSALKDVSLESLLKFAEQAPRPPKDVLAATQARYENDPEFVTSISGGLLKQWESKAKEKQFTTIQPLLDQLPQAKSLISNLKDSLSQQLEETNDADEKKSLQDQIRKATIALADFDSYSTGSVPKNAGRASQFAWAMRQAIPDVKDYANGGTVQRFMAGGAVRSKTPKLAFGTGDYPFPQRISNSYFKVMQKMLDEIQVERVFERYPKDERIMVDEASVSRNTGSFNLELFKKSFSEKISRDGLFSQMGQFARFIGLPQDDLSSFLPTQIDFIKPQTFMSGASFSTDTSGPNTRGLEGVDLSAFGFTEADKQDMYGYSKLIEEKKKEHKKTKSQSVNDEIEDLEQRYSQKLQLNREAIKKAKESRKAAAEASGRGSVNIVQNPDLYRRTKYDFLYHEMTHQLLQTLRTKQADTFTKYKERVSSLFAGDNDDLADAFDSLGAFYTSADIVYGRSYKLTHLGNISATATRKNLESVTSFGPKPTDSDKEALEKLRDITFKARASQRAREFKPLNPDVNSLLLNNGYDQSVIDRMEDNGKEEFLTTLVEKLPVLDSNLENILNSTLDSLFSDAGMSRRPFAQGGSAESEMKNRAIEALRGQQMTGSEMMKAAKIAGYEISERDDGMVEFIRGGRIMHTLSRKDASHMLGSMVGGTLARKNSGGYISRFADGGSVDVDENIKKISAMRMREIDIGMNLRRQFPAMSQEEWQKEWEKIRSAPGGSRQLAEELFGSEEAVNRIITERAAARVKNSYKNGGLINRFVDGGTVPALVSNGEAYVPPKMAKKIGYGNLNRMNQADRNGMGRFSKGGISVFKGPGTGTSDSIPTNLPVGSFIIREKATKALGLNKGGAVQRFADGGSPEGGAPNLYPGLDTKPFTFLEEMVIKAGNAFRSSSSIVSNTGNIFGSLDISFSSLARALDEYSSILINTGQLTVDQENLMYRAYEKAAKAVMSSGDVKAMIDAEKKWVAALNSAADSLREGIIQNATRQQSGGPATPSVPAAGPGIELPNTRGLSSDELDSLFEAERELKELQAKKVNIQVDPSKVEDLDRRILEITQKINDLNALGSSPVPASASPGPMPQIPAPLPSSGGTPIPPRLPPSSGPSIPVPIPVPSGGGGPSGPRTPPPVPKSAEQQLAAVQISALEQKSTAKENVKSEYDLAFQNAASQDSKKFIQEEARTKYEAIKATIESSKASQEQAILQDLLAQKAKENSLSVKDYISSLQDEITTRTLAIIEKDGGADPTQARQQAVAETIGAQRLQAFNIPELSSGNDLISTMSKLSEKTTSENNSLLEADKAKAAAAARAADELELLSLLASQSGVSLKAFKQNLEKELGSTFITLKNEVPKLVGSVRANIAQNRDKLTSSDDKVTEDATKSLGEDIRRAVGSSEVSGVSNEQIDKFIADLQDKLKDSSMSFDDAIKSVDGLQDALKKASSEAQLQARAIEAVSASSGAAKNTLDEMAGSAIKAAQALDASKQFNEKLKKLSLAIGTAGSLIQSGLQQFGGSENATTAVASSVVSGATQTASAGLALAGQVNDPKLKGLILLGTAAMTVAGAFKDAHNALRNFNLEMSQKRLDQSLNRVSNLFDEFSKDSTKLDVLDRINKELSFGSKQLITNLQNDLTVPKAMWANMFDLGGGAESAGRSMILEKEGVMSYLRSSMDMFGGDAYRERTIQRLAPEKAVETAQKAQPQGQNILRQFENRLRTGENIDDILSELKVAGNETAEVLARMNPKINEQIMLIQNDSSLTMDRKNAITQDIIATEASRVATLNMKNSIKQLEFERLEKQTNNFAASLERMFNGMEQAINKVSFDLDKLSRSAELSASALSGNAKAGDVMLDSINVLQNPRAYSGAEQGAAFDQAAGMFGSQAGLIRPLLGLGDKLEGTVMKTINSSVQANPNATTEGIAGNIRAALDKQLRDLGLPPNIADKLAGQTKEAFAKIRSKGDDTRLNFDQVVEEVPAFSKAISSAQRAQELANKAMEFYQKNVNEYAQAMNQMVDYQIEANSRMRKASEIQAKGNMELSRTLGKRITLDESRRVSEAPIRSMTGGLTDARDIGRNVVNLENTRRAQQASVDSAANRGPAGKDEFAVMQNRLRNTNTALRENIDALKQMADSTDLAQAALQKIQDVQARRQAGANLIEKMVTSSPEELAKLNASIGRLNNNMRGGLNIGSTSEQRGETLQAFNMLAPLLGDGQKQNELRANVLESMLKESGLGIDSTMQGVLDSLRDPEGDPQMAEAIGVYRESLAKQSEANTVLAELQNLMAANTAEIAATKLATAISGVKLNFEQQVMSDIANKIQVLIDVVKNNAKNGQNPLVPQNKQKGGIIYASMGRAIDFAPKGTDTVPAMLTPGEFVVNRAATKANLPLLHSINNGYSKGGKVKYYQDGGAVSISGSLSKYENTGQAMQDFDAKQDKKATFETKRISKEKLLDPDTIKTVDSKAILDVYGVKRNYYAAPSTDGILQFEQNSFPKWQPSLGSSYDSISFNQNIGTDIGALAAGVGAGGVAAVGRRKASAKLTAEAAEQSAKAASSTNVFASMSGGMGDAARKTAVASKTAAKEGGEAIAKKGLSKLIPFLGKNAGKLGLKRIPGASLLFSAYSLGKGLYSGDVNQIGIGLLEAASGVASLFPVVGTAISLAIDAAIVAGTTAAALTAKDIAVAADASWTPDISYKSNIGTSSNLSSDSLGKVLSKNYLDSILDDSGDIKIKRNVDQSEIQEYKQNLIDYRNALKEIKVKDNLKINDQTPSWQPKIDIKNQGIITNRGREKEIQEATGRINQASSLALTDLTYSDEGYAGILALNNQTQSLDNFLYGQGFTAGQNKPFGLYVPSTIGRLLSNAGMSDGLQLASGDKVTTPSRWNKITQSISNLKSDKVGSQYSIDDTKIANEKSNNLIKNIDDIISQIDTNKLEFEETEASAANKKAVSELEALYNNRIYSLQLNKDKIKIPDGAEEPLTFFNIPQDKWIADYKAYVETYPDSKNKTFSYDKDNFLKLTPVNDGDTKLFPWKANNFKIDDSLTPDESVQQSQFQTTRTKNFTITPATIDNNKFKFTYSSIKGPYLNPTSKNFSDSQQKEYGIIQPGGDPTWNPFAELSKPLFFDGNIDNLLNALQTFIPDSHATRPDPENITPYKVKLDKNIAGFIKPVSSIENFANLQGNEAYKVLDDVEKASIVLSNDGNIPLIDDVPEFTLEKYTEARKQRIIQAQLNKAKENVGKATGARFEKLSTAESAFTSSSRLKIAQAVQRLASAALSNYGIGIPSISKIEDVGGVAGYLNNYLSKMDNKSIQWAETNAWRGLFSELFQPKNPEAAAAYLKGFGVNIEQGTINESGIKNIIAREKAIAIGKNVSGDIPENDLKNLDLETTKTKLYTVGADGKKTEIRPENIQNPKTVQDVEKIALAPENLFENNEKRQRYLKVLSDYFTKNNLTEFSGAVNSLKTWYGAQDSLLNASLTPPQLDNSLNLINEGKADSVKIIESKSDYDPANLLLTGEKYGSLPSKNRMIDLIKVRKEEAKTEEKQQQAVDPGNFANGGLVYASNGTLVNYQPRGTDTVPAMLTPGEFVINRDSTNKYRPVLEAINNGSYSRGGIVNYLKQGGYIVPKYLDNGGAASGSSSGGSFDFTKYMSGLTNSLISSITTAVDKALSNIKQPNNSSNGVSNNNADLASIDNFVNRLNNIANILSNIYIPPQITITGKHDVVVTINGDTVLNQLRPDIAGIVVSAIRSAFADLKAKNPENNTINFDIDINANRFAGNA